MSCCRTMNQSRLNRHCGALWTWNHVRVLLATSGIIFCPKKFSLRIPSWNELVKCTGVMKSFNLIIGECIDLKPALDTCSSDYLPSKIWSYWRKTSQSASDGWFQSLFFVPKCYMLLGQSLRRNVNYSYSEILIQWSSHIVKYSFSEVLIQWRTHSVK